MGQPAGRVDIVFGMQAGSYSAGVDKMIAWNKQIEASSRRAHGSLLRPCRRLRVLFGS